MNMEISQLIIQKLLSGIKYLTIFPQKKMHYLRYSQKGPVVFTRSAQVLAQLFMLLNTKQGIL